MKKLMVIIENFLCNKLNIHKKPKIILIDSSNNIEFGKCSVCNSILTKRKVFWRTHIKKDSEFENIKKRKFFDFVA